MSVEAFTSSIDWTYTSTCHFSSGWSLKHFFNQQEPTLKVPKQCDTVMNFNLLLEVAIFYQKMRVG